MLEEGNMPIVSSYYYQAWELIEYGFWVVEQIHPKCGTNRRRAMFDRQRSSEGYEQDYLPTIALQTRGNDWEDV